MSENEEQYQVSLALAFLSRYIPCAHENADTSIGVGGVWAKCEDCGAGFQQENWGRARAARLDFERALETMSGVHEKLLDEYAKRGDARGALGSAWSWVGNEWACDDHEMYVAQINDLEGNLTWCFGYMGCEEIANVEGPRAGMRVAEGWARTHPEEAPEALLPSVTFNAKEVEVLRRIHARDTGGVLDVYDGMTPEEAKAFCAKLGIG